MGTELMRAAGFRYVFLGIENILDEDLFFLHAASKNTKHEDGRRAGNAAITAIEHLHRSKAPIGCPVHYRNDCIYKLPYLKHGALFHAG